MNIFLISCVKSKKTVSSFAKDLYDSDLFKKAYNYAKANKADKIFILSAKYGLVDEMTIIDPYDETLINKNKSERIVWANNVITELSKYTNLEHDRFTILAGKKYHEFLLPHIASYRLPVQGLQIGKQLSFYKKALMQQTTC